MVYAADLLRKNVLLFLNIGKPGVPCNVLPAKVRMAAASTEIDRLSSN
jgi:hypothetical protein